MSQLNQMKKYNLIQPTFNNDEIEKIAFDSIDKVLKDASSYDDSKVDQWINNICEDVMQKLAASMKPYKYVVTCTLSQKTNAGLQVTSSHYWENQNDSRSSNQAATHIYGLRQ